VSEHTGYPGAPPGWYSDPAGGHGKRWWDGYSWTDATVVPGAAPPPPAPPGSGPARPPVWPGDPTRPPTGSDPWAAASVRLDTYNTRALVDREMQMVTLGRIAVAVPAACAVANLIIARFNATAWRDLGHHMRIVFHDAQQHVTPPPYTGPREVTPLSLLVTLVSIVAAVIALIWQHRAASAGRALGIPSGQSPAWGVGSWFVPIVNLWIPYQAVRDCLPPDDPHRRRVLHWWLAWLATGVLSAAANACALFSSTTAVIVSIPAIVTALAIVAWAPGIAMAIATAHRSAVDTLHRGTGALTSSP
jgi:hypothetical protein